MALNLTIVGYGHTRCGPEWGFATQGENFHRVYFVLGGDCRCTIHGETYFLQPETLYIPMDMQQWLRSVMDAPVRKALPVLSFPSIQLTGITVRDLIASSEAQAEGMAAIARRCDAAASVSMMDLSVEAECFGSTILVSDDEVPTVTGAVVSSMEDVERLPTPQVGDGRTGIYVEAIAKAKKRITDRPVFAGVIGPYSLAGRLMDVSQIMLNSIVEPEMVHATLRKANDFLKDYIRAYKNVGADGVVIAEPAAGLLPPDMSLEFSANYIKEIVDELQDENFIIIYHNCGNAVGFMVPEILTTGCAAYHFGNAVDMAEMLEKMPPDVLTMGNVDPVSVLRNGTPEVVRAETLRILEKCCGHKNFLISSGCDIPPAAPWENLDAFFAAVAEFYRR